MIFLRVMTICVAMALGAIAVELRLGAVALIGQERNALFVWPSQSPNDAIDLNLLVLSLAGVLIFRSQRTGVFATLATAHARNDDAGMIRRR